VEPVTGEGRQVLKKKKNSRLRSLLKPVIGIGPPIV
jgi:hypothetical protein